jgi:aspartate kinase
VSVSDPDATDPLVPTTPLVVQKYGGSSLAGADRIKHVARRIARERAAGVDLVVVVSAMGDTTDELIGLAHQLTDEPDPREMDVLLATGEHMSGTLVTMALHALGVAAISLTGPQAGIRTDSRHGRARIANLDPSRLQRELEGGKVVIVAGFQGATGDAYENADITTLGRGGSDTTAVALAARLAAVRCEIFTDVEGIFTADPRIVPDARLLPVVGYEEMLELAQQGAQVMQTRAVELGWVNGIEIAVRSTFGDQPGTRIKEDPVVEQRNKVRGLATDRNVAKVTLVEVPDQPGVARAVFAPLADAGINVDMIVQNVSHGGTTDLSFTIPQVDLAHARKLLEAVRREIGAAELLTDSSVGKVSIVGAGIQTAPGYAARMFGTLADAGINIEMISTSEIRITCIISEDDLERAARALHRAFALEEPDALDLQADHPGAAIG